MHAGKSQCMQLRVTPHMHASVRIRQADACHACHARRARGGGAPRAWAATPAELVQRASRPLSCSRESLTLPAAFLVVKINCGQKLVAAGSLEQVLSSSMGGLLIYVIFIHICQNGACSRL